MPPRRILFAAPWAPAVAILILFSGCSAPDAAPPVSTVPSVSAPTGSPASLGVELTQARTEAALPGADALGGSGWTAQRTTLDPDKVTTGPSTRVRSDCTISGALALAALPDRTPSSEAEVHLATGSGASSQAAGVQVLSYADELGATDLLRVQQAIDECSGFTVTLASGAVVPATIAPLAVSTEYGDGVFAVRASYLEGGTLRFQDIGHIVVGHTLINFLQVGTGTVGLDVVPALAVATMAKLQAVTAAP